MQIRKRLLIKEFTNTKTKSNTKIFIEDYLTVSYQYVRYPEQEFL
jgi:hypothetical protein